MKATKYFINDEPFEVYADLGGKMMVLSMVITPNGVFTSWREVTKKPQHIYANQRSFSSILELVEYLVEERSSYIPKDQYERTIKALLQSI